MARKAGSVEVQDFRSDRMESPEGRGIARARWEASPEGRAGKPGGDPNMGRLTRWMAAPTTLDIAGFWVMWQLRGGFEGSRSSARRPECILTSTSGPGLHLT
jgi:hypothetical protein